MPLSTQIIRNGQALRLRWGNFHIAAMALAASFDEGTNIIGHPSKVYDQDTMKDPDFWACYPDMAFPVTRHVAFMLTDYGALSKTPLNNGVYTLRSRQTFLDLEDGEVLRLLPGDALHAWR